MAEEFVEHRRTERFRLQVPARIQPVHKAVEDTYELITNDICSGGAYFHTDKPLPLGTEVKIEIILPLNKMKKSEGKHAHIRAQC